MTWWLAALLAAVVQGIHYPIIDRALEHLHTYTVLVIITIPMVVLYPFFHHQIVSDFAVLTKLPLSTQLLIFAGGLTSTLTAFLVYYAINASNATLASLIEVTYPLFVVLFAYLMLGENHLSVSVAVGGLLILLGTGVIISGN